ncbi:kinase-like domain-containing protein [Phanerochaete sordida]|uniref:Kinase-like domain-containing protein n=1 Tax=Phanerochaete sordida TaxID=48140 RepID=A0A9P3GAP9_9APHY|nr:kinase-like domain-containing protein [Phanerochaete sordida]
MHTDRLSHNLTFHQPPADPYGRGRELPAIFTGTEVRGEDDMKLFGLPEETVQSPDSDQKASEQFLIAPHAGFKSQSAPDPFEASFFSPPVSQSDFAETDVSASPAAMFLSAFSPMTASSSLPDAEGEEVAGYVLGPIVGHGAFAIVRRASSSQGGTVAVKIVRRSDLDKQEDPAKARAALDHEAAVWASLSHENILPLFSSSHTPYADFFVTLYCPAGSLFDILKRDGRPALPLDETGRMYRQVVKGLRYMHEVAGVVHRDLKLENVLVDDMGVCRIGDFGMAKRIGELESDADEEDRPTRSARAQTIAPSRSLREKRSRSRKASHGPSAITTHLSLLQHRSGPRHRNSSPLPGPSEAKQVRFVPGSLPYASPELLTPPNSTTAHRVHPAQDIWALGVMLYTLLTGRMPFADSFEPRLQMKILAGVYEMPEGVGKGAESVLEGCLERSVQDRWTIDMVDEVAWGIGCDSPDDEASYPSDMLPPTRSRSQSRPASVPEHALVDDDGPSSPVMERGNSRSRSGRSRSRLSAFHPYHHDHHFPTHHESDPSMSVVSPSILRSISTSSGSTSSTLESPRSFIPQSSAERGRGSHVSFEHALLSGSRSRSPSDSPLSPIDVATVLATRGRKPSRATAPPSPHELHRLVQLPEHGPPSAESLHDIDSALAVDSPQRVTRSASRDAWARTRPALRRASIDADKSRAESVPPHSLCSMPWSAQSFQTGRARTAAATPTLHGKAPGLRSRSVCRP